MDVDLDQSAPRSGALQCLVPGLAQVREPVLPGRGTMRQKGLYSPENLTCIT